MTPRKVLYVIGNSQFGGGERDFLQLCRGLDRAAWTPLVAAAPGGEFERRAREAGCAFHALPFGRADMLATSRKLAALIASDGVDLVHAQGARACWMAERAARRAGRAKLVWTVAMPPERFDVAWWKRWLYRALERRAERGVDRFITVSEDLRALLTGGHGIAPAKVVAVPNAVEVDRFDPALDARAAVRASLGIDGAGPLVGTLGRLVYQKDLPNFLRAAGVVRAGFPSARFVVAGEGPLGEDLRALAAELGLADAVSFPGPRWDVPEFLSALDVFVLSSVQEGMPITVLEAMAMARPIAATALPGIRETLRDGETALLVAPQDPGALAAAVGRFLGEPALGRRLGAAARAAVEDRHDGRGRVARVAEIYAEVLR